VRGWVLPAKVHQCVSVLPGCMGNHWTNARVTGGEIMNSWKSISLVELEHLVARQLQECSDDMRAGGETYEQQEKKGDPRGYRSFRVSRFVIVIYERTVNGFHIAPKTESAGYAFITVPPVVPLPENGNCQINTTRLVVQWAAIAGATWIIVKTIATRARKEETELSGW